MHPAQPRFARPGGVHNNRICLKKWHFPDLVCSVHVLTITTGLSYSNRSRLKKWHFLDLICSVHVVTNITGLSYSNRSCLKKWHLLNLIRSVHIVAITIGVSCKLPQKVALSGPNMFSTFSNHLKWSKL